MSSSSSQTTLFAQITPIWSLERVYYEINIDGSQAWRISLGSPGKEDETPSPQLLYLTQYYYWVRRVGTRQSNSNTGY